jgi:hypothetical protein
VPLTITPPTEVLRKDISRRYELKLGLELGSQLEFCFRATVGGKFRDRIRVRTIVGNVYKRRRM